MKYLFFLVGIGVTFKSGPISIASVISISDMAALCIITVLFLKLFSDKQRRKHLLITRVNTSHLVISSAYLLTVMSHSIISGFNKLDLANFLTVTLILLSVFCFYQLSFTAKTAKGAKEYADAFMLGVLTGLILPYAMMKVGIASPQEVLFFPGGRYKAYMNHQNIVGIVSSFVIAYFLAARLPIWKTVTFVALAFIPLLLCTSKFNLALSTFLVFTFFVFKTVRASTGVRFMIWGFALAFMFPFASVFFNAGLKLLIAVNPEGAARIAAFAANPTNSHTFTERLYLWESAFKNGTEALPFGVGVGRAPEYLLGLSHAHNGFLNNYLIFGIPGVVHYIAILVLCLLGTKRSFLAHRYLPETFFASLIGLVASNISDSFSNTAALVIYPLIGMGWAMTKLENRR